MQQRRYPAAEYTRIEGSPLPPQRLAAIWRGLPEGERFGFVLALDEKLADQVIELTAAPAQSTGERERP
jgi:hypothetical protein